MLVSADDFSSYESHHTYSFCPKISMTGALGTLKKLPVIVKSHKTVLGTVVEHEEHLTGETDKVTLRAVSFLTVVQPLCLV